MSDQYQHQLKAALKALKAAGLECRREKKFWAVTEEPKGTRLKRGQRQISLHLKSPVWHCRRFFVEHPAARPLPRDAAKRGHMEGVTQDIDIPKIRGDDELNRLVQVLIGGLRTRSDRGRG
jgi:hypothetical protein